MKVFTTLVPGITLGFLSVAGLAMPVHWEFSGMIFGDGGTGSGSFIYDADTDVFSDISITTTAGSVLDGTVYEFYKRKNVIDNELFVGFIETLIGDLNNVPYLQVRFSAPLTNAGGTVPLISASEGHCVVDEEFPDCILIFNARGATSTNAGVVTGTVIPIPAAVWLFGAALGWLGWMRRKAI